jgi:hypothetical protein
LLPERIQELGIKLSKYDEFSLLFPLDHIITLRRFGEVTAAPWREASCLSVKIEPEARPCTPLVLLRRKYSKPLILGFQANLNISILIVLNYYSAQELLCFIIQ